MRTVQDGVKSYLETLRLVIDWEADKTTKAQSPVPVAARFRACTEYPIDVMKACAKTSVRVFASQNLRITSRLCMLVVPCASKCSQILCLKPVVGLDKQHQVQHSGPNDKTFFRKTSQGIPMLNLTIAGAIPMTFATAINDGCPWCMELLRWAQVAHPLGFV